MIRRCFGIVLGLVAMSFSTTASADVIARLRGDFKEETPAAGWLYAWNSGALTDDTGYKPLVWNAKYKFYSENATTYPSPTPAGHANLGKWSGHPGRGGKGDRDRYLITQFTVPADQDGIAWVSDGSAFRAGGSDPQNSVELQVLINGSVRLTKVVTASRVPSTFVAELGELRKGDRVAVAVGPNGTDLNDGLEFDYCINVLPPGEKPADPQIVVHAPADRPAQKGVAGRPDPAFMKMHESFLERGRQGDIDLLFIGDSITAGWNGGGKAAWASSFAPLRAANFGIGGDMTQHVLWRIANDELDSVKPRAVVLLIGTNNTGGYNSDEVAEGIVAIVRQIRLKLPQTKVLLLGVFPRGATPTEPARERIRTINATIAGLDDGQNVRYLDIGGKFLQADGTISKDIMPDFLHLSPQGYQIWADAVRPLLLEMMGRNGQ